MTGSQKLLTGLLVVQAILAVSLWWPAKQSQVEPRPFLDITPEQATSVTITGSPGGDSPPDSVHLVRKDDQWVVESSFGYPADKTRVDELLDKLTGIRVKHPIATKTTSHTQLKVGEQEYGKRVVLETTDSVSEVFIGAAASNSVNVRLSGEDQVYRVRGFSEWSISDRPQRYMDTVYLEQDPDSIEVLTIENSAGSFTLDHSQDEWVLLDGPEGSRLDQDEVQRFVKKVAKVRMREPAGREVLPEYGLDKGTTVQWTATGEDSTVGASYRIGAEDDGKVYIKSEDSPFVIKATASSFKAVTEARVADFLESGQ